MNGSTEDSQKSSVVGIFDSKDMIESAVDKLREEGFKNENISIVKAGKITSQPAEPLQNESARDRVISGASKGFVIGANLGMILGSVMFLVPILAAGVIFSSLLAAGIGGILGGLLGPIIGFGAQKSLLKKNKHVSIKEGFILSVQCEGPEWIRRAKKSLEILGAHGIA